MAFSDAAHDYAIVADHETPVDPQLNGAWLVTSSDAAHTNAVDPRAHKPWPGGSPPNLAFDSPK